MGARAAILVTGTEVLTGRVADRNGPWLAEQLRRFGVDIAQVTVIGDRPDDLRRALRDLRAAGVDLIITTGGLGPTADDLTTELVASAQARALRLDPELERQVADRIAQLSSSRKWDLEPQATAASIRKQSLVPEGATVIAPVGTAAGLIVPATVSGEPPVVVLPGPPFELQSMWSAVVADPVVRAALTGRAELRQSAVRLWGTPESELAATLRRIEHSLDGLEITTCLRDGGELEIVTRYSPAMQPAYDALVAELQATYPGTLFSADGRTVDELVADALISRQLTVATAESCTAGLLAGRLTDLPGSSAYLLGGLVVYSNRAKAELAGVPAELIARVGAVSPEVAAALAGGARDRLHADIGIGITGIAGPDGGSPDKPVGLVYLCASGLGVERTHTLRAPGSRADVRARAVSVAMHMLRRLLDEARVPA
jgi:nicotinamide-nucleotide amidase